jgi:hypothetical protein
MRHHYTCWSMTRFMVETNPAGYACLNGKLHGRKTADGHARRRGPALRAARALFQECFGMSYAEFDQALARLGDHARVVALERSGVRRAPAPRCSGGHHRRT